MAEEELKDINSLIEYYAYGGEYDSFDRLKKFVLNNPDMKDTMPVYIGILFVKSTSSNEEYDIFTDLTNACMYLGLPINYHNWLDQNHMRLINAICP